MSRQHSRDGCEHSKPRRSARLAQSALPASTARPAGHDHLETSRSSKAGRQPVGLAPTAPGSRRQTSRHLTPSLLQGDSIDRLQTLPDELLVEVAGHCSNPALRALTLTTRRLSGIAEQVLYRRNIQDRNGDSLAWAAHKGVVDTIKKALWFGADVDSVHDFPPASGWAVPRGCCGRRMLRARPSESRIKNRTALNLACAAGRDDVVELLLDHRADPEIGAVGLCGCGTFSRRPASGLGASHYSRRRIHRFPLHTAICTGRASTALLLLKKISSRKLSCEDDAAATGTVVAHVAANNGNVGDQVRSDGQTPPWSDTTPTPIRLAARNGLVSVVEYLVNTDGVDINEGRPVALAQALLHEKGRAIVGDLLRLGADPNCRINRVKSALVFACERSLFPEALALLDAGADAEDAPESDPPLHIVCQKFHDAAGGADLRLELVRALLARGAGVDSRGTSGLTPLMALFVSDSPGAFGIQTSQDADDQAALARLLLEHGADVNAVALTGSHAGKTPLLFAARTCRSIVGLELLVSHGADVTYSDGRGMDALMVACDAMDASSDPVGAIQIFHLLLDNGADPTRSCIYGATALHFACQRFSAASAIKAWLLPELVKRGADPNATMDVALSMTLDNTVVPHIFSIVFNAIRQSESEGITATAAAGQGAETAGEVAPWPTPLLTPLDVALYDNEPWTCEVLLGLGARLVSTARARFWAFFVAPSTLSSGDRAYLSASLLAPGSIKLVHHDHGRWRFLLFHHGFDRQTRTEFLMQFLILGDRKRVMDILDGAIDPDAVDSSGNTLLHWADYWDFGDVEKKLIKAGAHPVWPPRPGTPAEPWYPSHHGSSHAAGPPAVGPADAMPSDSGRGDPAAVGGSFFPPSAAPSDPSTSAGDTGL